MGECTKDNKMNLNTRFNDHRAFGDYKRFILSVDDMLPFCVKITDASLTEAAIKACADNNAFELYEILIRAGVEDIANMKAYEPYHPNTH